MIYIGLTIPLPSQAFSSLPPFARSNGLLLLPISAMTELGGRF